MKGMEFLFCKERVGKNRGKFLKMGNIVFESSQNERKIKIKNTF